MTIRGWNDAWQPVFDSLARMRASWPTRGWSWDPRLMCVTSSFTTEQEPAARTATTPVVGARSGNAFPEPADATVKPSGMGKSAPLIAMAHEIPYVATATVADLHDLEAKVFRAMQLRGARYLHVLVPCPLGWGSKSSDTIRVARLATESGYFPVFEAERGEVVAATPIRHRVPVEEYLRLQTRYAHLFSPTVRTDVIARIQAQADRNIRRFSLLEGIAPLAEEDA